MADAQSSSVEQFGDWDREGFTPVLGANIHYAVRGEGDPVVMLHKMGGWYADYRWAAPHIAQRYQAVAMDAPGQGLSRISGELAYVLNIEEHATAIVSALESIGITRFHIVGCSLGGDIGVVASAFYPDRVKTLTLCSMSLGDYMSVPDLIKRDESGFYAGGFGPNEIAIPTRPEDVADGWFIDKTRVSEMNASRLLAGRWMIRVSRGISHCDFPSYLPRIQCPTLLLYGEKGHFNQFGDLALEKIKDSRRYIVPGGNSFVFEESMGVVTPMLFEHFERVR